MNRERQRIQTAKKGGSGSIEQLVAYAVNTGISSGASSLPLAVTDDFFQRHAVAGSAPSRDHNIRIPASHFVGSDLASGCPQKLTSGSVNEFGNPGLRCDEGLSPFFTENFRTSQSRSSGADLFDLLLHLQDHCFTAFTGADRACDRGDIRTNIGKSPWGESQEADARLEYFGDCFLLEGHGCDDEIGCSGNNFLGIRCPGIGEDGVRLRRNFWDYIGAILRAGDYATEFANGREDDRSTGLQVGDAAWCVGGWHDLSTL